MLEEYSWKEDKWDGHDKEGLQQKSIQSELALALHRHMYLDAL